MITGTIPSKWIFSTCLKGTRSLAPIASRCPLLPVKKYSTVAPSDAARNLEYTRNIGIIAHIDAGKTTTTERMLYYSGFTRRLGDVDDGSTVTDFLPAERARGITIQSAAITFHWPPKSSEDLKLPALDELKAKNLPRSSVPNTINLIDTPGHADFTFEVLRSLRILDGAVCILDGVAGVEAQTENVWNQASIYKIPRIVYINKLDRVGAAFGRTVKEVGSKLGGWPAVCQIPWFETGAATFRGIGDVVSLQGLFWEEGGDGKKIKMSTLTTLEEMDPTFADELKKARVALVELLSEYDENMIECFLENDENHLAVKPLDILESLRRCTLAPGAKLIPVLAGASFRNIGVQPLLDCVSNILPSPMERPDPEISISGTKGGLQGLLNRELALESKNSAATQNKKKKTAPQTNKMATALEKLEGCALAFKVVSDNKRGVIVYVRVYSGSINRNVSLYNTNLGTTERAPRLLKMYASEAVEVPSIEAGHIGVIVGLKHARTGDTLLAYPGNKAVPPEPLNTLQLRPINVPPPVFFASIEPHSLSEEKHLHEALALLLREDPSLHVTVDEDSGQTLLSGMGELHLEIARDRLVNDFKAKATMGSIEIGYRENVSGTSSAVTKFFDKEIAGRKGKAACTAFATPFDPEMEQQHQSSTDLPKDAAFSEIKDGNSITLIIPGLSGYPNNRIPEDVLPPHLNLEIIKTALYNGTVAALARGPLHSFPLRGTHITITLDLGSHIYGNETTPSALSAVARLATSSSLREVSSTSSLMEPVMNVTISVNEASMGSVIHDISSARGGHIVSLDDDSDAAGGIGESEDRTPIDISKIYAPPDPYGASSSLDVDSTSTTAPNQMRTITAKVPLKEMVGYLKHLRSLTGGRGTFVMSVDKFERMGSQREKAALAAIRGGL